MLLIPAIEWDKKTIDGIITEDNPTISNISDTSEIEEGYVLSSGDFPYNTRVVSKTVNSITLSNDALNSDANFSGDFYKRYEFEYPPSTDNEEQSSIQKRVATSLSGKRQVVTDYIELTRSLTFGFITPQDRDILKSFYEDFAALGNKFRYFDDKAINSFVVYEDDNDDFNQSRQAKKAGGFLYEISFQFRRVK